MKIKSIKLTSEHEIKNSDPKAIYLGASKTPVYQVEYEETTPTGLTARGTVTLDAVNDEKVTTLFKELEAILLVREKEIADDLPESLLQEQIKATLHEEEIVLTKDVANLIFNISMGNETTKTIEEALKRLDRSKKFR